jgi:flagellar assembly protein FliH
MAAFETSGLAGGVAVLEFRSLEDELEGGAPVEPEGFSDSGNAARAAEAAVAVAVAAEREAARQEGFQRGDQEGRSKARVEMEAEMLAMVGRERARLVGVVEEFRGAREEYFGGVEQEVVKLALAIAARVLHRETQVDPLLLEGAVRVALEKMAERAGVVLRAATVDVAAWEQAFHGMDAEDRPKVRGDAGLARGECVLETKMGTVELGVTAQLEEIEKGFFDLLSHRPRK